MLKFGNKEFRNLQEQVEENMKDIANLKSGQAVLDEFGIKVVGEVESIDDLPTVSEYKELAPDWEYGDAYAVGTVAPYTLYILTRANGSHEEDYWFDIGEFPAAGPQGPQGPQGPEGQQGQTGDTGPAGVDAGFGTPTATATMTAKGSAPTVNITSSGPNTEKVFNFDFYLPVATPKVTITSVSGTLTLADYNILYNFEDSVVVYKPSGSLAHTAYTLQRWYSSDDYIVFICLFNFTPYKTGVYRCRVDRSNRSYLIYADEAIKINKYNISTAINSTTNEAAGKVLTADGNGGASWEDGGSIGSSTVTITVTSGTFSDSDYLKVAGDGCTIIYDDNTTKVSFRKYDETSTTITYAGPFTEGNMTYWYGVGINKAGKTWVMSSVSMPISATNIKSGNHVSGLVLTTNGSGGSSWESLPTPTALAWGNITGTLSNQTDLKNALDDKQDELTEPDTPTGTIYEYLGFTSAGVVSKNTMVPVSKISDIADVAITGSYTDLLNQPSIPDPQVQSNWTQTNSSKVDYIKNKPDLSIYAQSANLASVATSGDYDDLIDKPDLSIYAESADLATVATTGDYDDLIDKPDLSIYAETSDLATVATTGDYDDLIDKPTLATVATSGSYNDLSNKPTIPDVSHMVTDNTTQTISGSKTFSSNTNFKDAISFYDPIIQTQLNGTISGGNGELGIVGSTYFRSTGATYNLLVPSTSTYTADKTIATTDQIPAAQVNSDWNAVSGVAQILNKPNLATVATSGSYTDLTDKPTIPDVSNMVTTDTAQTITATKTFKGWSSFLIFKNGSDYGLGAIQSGNHNGNDYIELQGSHVCLNATTVLLSPNSNGYGLKVPSTSSYTANKTIATTDDIPVVPTNISSFTNDSGYITGINSSDVTTALGYTPLANTACTYQTTAPTAAIADGGVHIVYLSSEPATKYSGYIYMIAEA